MAFSSFLPYFFSSSTRPRDWWDLWDSPHRLMDQNFGMGLSESDLLPPIVCRGYIVRPRTQENVDHSGQSVVKRSKDYFEISLETKQFDHKEMNVKVHSNFIVISGKHGEKKDEHGLVSREFTRRYMIPEDVDVTTVSSDFKDCVLTVRASRKPMEAVLCDKEVPISTQMLEEKEEKPESPGDEK